MKMAFVIASLALSLLALPARAAEWTLNGATVDCAWTEATQNGIAPVYMEIRADDRGSQRLLSAASDFAEAAEVDSYTRVAGVLRRQRIEYLPIEANQAVQLLPGGYHVLLVGLKEPLIAGTSFEGWVEFQPAGGFLIQIQVVPPGAGSPCGPGTRPSGRPAIRDLPVPPPIWIPRGSF
jgi:periplasmic copper chaperone A